MSYSRAIDSAPGSRERRSLAWPLMRLGTGGSAGGAGGAVDRCFVLDEKAIEYLGLVCSEDLTVVGNGARSVVACRARKDQKAQMLELIRYTHSLRPLTSSYVPLPR